MPLSSSWWNNWSNLLTFTPSWEKKLYALTYLLICAIGMDHISLVHTEKKLTKKIKRQENNI